MIGTPNQLPQAVIYYLSRQPKETNFMFMRLRSMPLACLMLLSYSKVPFLICSQCYKTFLLETLIYPFVKTTRLSHFKSNRQFNSVLLLENIIVMAFLCKFRHQNQLFDFLNFSGNLDFPKKVLQHRRDYIFRRNGD